MIAHESGNLLVDLGIGNLGRRHLDLNGVVSLELGLGCNLDVCRYLEVLALLGKRCILAKVGVGQRHDVELVVGKRHSLLNKIARSLSQNSLAADHAIDDLGRNVATTEALEVVACGNLAIGVLDSGVYIGLVDGDACGQLPVLGLLELDGNVQRSSSDPHMRHGAAFLPGATYRVVSSWCGRKDLNLHGISPTGT